MELAKGGEVFDKLLEFGWLIDWLIEVCLVMELAKGGEVFDKLLEFGCLSENESAKLMSQVREHT